MLCMHQRLAWHPLPLSPMSLPTWPIYRRLLLSLPYLTTISVKVNIFLTTVLAISLYMISCVVTIYLLTQPQFHLLLACPLSCFLTGHFDLKWLWPVCLLSSVRPCYCNSGIVSCMQSEGIQSIVPEWWKWSFCFYLSFSGISRSGSGVQHFKELWVGRSS